MVMHLLKEKRIVERNKRRVKTNLAFDLQKYRLKEPLFDSNHVKRRWDHLYYKHAHVYIYIYEE